MTNDVFVCSICSCEFDLEAEGGVIGDLGILPVAFCPTCRVGILDFAEQCSPAKECPKCGELIE